MSETFVTTREFAAYQAIVDERIQNLFSQITLLSNRVTALQSTQAITTFPTESAQIREKVMTSFESEIANFTNDILKLQADVAALQLAAEE